MFLFILFIGVVACNKDVVKENGEEQEGKPIKEGKVVNVEDAEKFFKGYSTELYCVKFHLMPQLLMKSQKILKYI